MSENTNTIAFDPCLDFDPMTLTLSHGSHGVEFTGQTCLVEAACQATVCCETLGAKYGKATQFGDDHPSISRVVRSYAISLNDAWTDSTYLRRRPDDWKRLRPYVTRILGTKTTGADENTRAWLATDWLVRVQAPAWLELAGLTERAMALRGLPPLTSAKIATGVQSVLEGARNDAAAAWDAAGAAARDAAGAAARDAAGDAAGAAAGAAARDAAWDAAWGCGGGCGVSEARTDRAHATGFRAGFIRPHDRGGSRGNPCLTPIPPPQSESRPPKI